MRRRLQRFPATLHFELTFLALLTVALFLFTSCAAENGSMIDAGQPDGVKTTEGPGRYHFIDDSVKTAVEKFLQKEAEELTEADLSTLADLKYFAIESSISQADDIPVLFPNLKYLNIRIKETADERIWKVLKEMENLEAITIYSNVVLDADLVKGLSYVEIGYGEAVLTTEPDSLASLSILGGRYIEEHMNEQIAKFVRVETEEKVFELFASGYLENENSLRYRGERKVFVSEKENGSYRNTDTLDFSGDYGDAIDNRLLIVDVNFDGKKDVLVDNGHFGNQGFVTYTAYLTDKDEKEDHYRYVRSESFTDIINPSVDTANSKILSTWRNWAASHSWAMYSYLDREYVMTDCLTEEADTTSQSEDEEIWIYRIEQLLDGKMKEVTRYSSSQISKEQIEELFYNEDGYWGLLSSKWKTLSNMGLMADFSIYSNNSINSTILDSIGEPY